MRLEVAGLKLTGDSGTDVSMWNSLISLVFYNVNPLLILDQLILN